MKQIKIQVARGENFTPASLMKRYADQTGTEFRRSFWGAAELVIESRFYQYHHWSITAENDVETVTLYLEEVNPMTIAKAKKLIQIDPNTLNETELQKYKVKVLDAWRYAKGDYGYGNDFFVYMPELKSFVPKEKWLLKNIESRLDLLGL